MDKEFKLEILSPERLFFSGSVKSITFETSDGLVSVLKNHCPALFSLKPCSAKIVTDEEEYVFLSDGFVSVRPDEVLIFTEEGERIDEIDDARARKAVAREQEKLNHIQNVSEIRHTRISLSRSIARLNTRTRYKK